MPSQLKIKFQVFFVAKETLLVSGLLIIEPVLSIGNIRVAPRIYLIFYRIQ